MISRVLPPEEWHRLKGTEAETLWPLLNPETARVLVVEDGGEIVATWTLMTVVHAECLWAKPEHRGSAGVAMRLFAAMRAAAAELGTASVVTSSTDAHVTDLISRFGGKSIPGESFVLPVEMTRARKLEQEAACPRQ